MALKSRYCLSNLLPLFLAFFFCIESFQLISIHINELDPLGKLGMYPLDLIVYFLAYNSVVRMTLGGSTQLYHMACFPQIHLDKIRIAIGKVDDVLSFLRHSLGYLFINMF